MKDNQKEQFFTELTPEEGAAVSGGNTAAGEVEMIGGAGNNRQLNAGASAPTAGQVGSAGGSRGADGKATLRGDDGDDKQLNIGTISDQAFATFFSLP